MTEQMPRMRSNWHRVSRRPSAGFAATVWRRFRRHRLALFGLRLLAALFLAAVLAPVLATHSFSAVAPAERLQPPSLTHWFGTDDVGRDVYSRMLFGARVSLAVGLVAAGFAVLIGTVVGAVAGYFGGRVDDLLMRAADVCLAFPTFFLLVTVAALLPRSLFHIMAVIGLTSWPGLARLVRAEFLTLREQDFALAARCIGASHRRIIFRHLLPNALAPIIVNATLRVGNAILAESGLSFLGLGVQEPYPSWGSMLNHGRSFYLHAPWLMLLPGLFIFLTVLACNFVGDGLRDALDPKLRR